MTFLAALRHDRIDAPWFIEGPIDGVSFRIYVEKVLLPTLRPGDIVVMDNLGSHRSKAVRQLIRSAGAKLFFLPKYSPDLNPIEQVFAKLKHLLRKAAALTVDAVCAAIGELLGAFTSEECFKFKLLRTVTGIKWVTPTIGGDLHARLFCDNNVAVDDILGASCQKADFSKDSAMFRRYVD